jgi:hypothetical protein
MKYSKTLFLPKWHTILSTLFVMILYVVLSPRPINILILILTGIIAYFVSTALFYFQQKENYSDKNLTEQTCTSCSELLPVMEPEFNLRECAKQLLLLEDHLNNPRKICQDCIKKHFLTAEALAEEGVSLDTKGTCKDECIKLAEKIRELEKRFSDGEDITQEIRIIRKPIMSKYFQIEKN